MANVVVTKASLEKLIKSHSDKITIAKAELRDAARKRVVLSLTEADSKSIALAVKAEKDAGAVLRKLVNELSLLREAASAAV